MGLASIILGENNPFAQWTNQNQNFLGAIGAGLGQGQNIQSGLAAGLAQVPQAKQLDQAAAEKLKADKLAETQVSATQNWLDANYPQYAHLPPDQGFKLAMQAEQEKISGGAAPQNPFMSAGDGTFFNWQTGEYVRDPNAPPASTGEQPASVREFQFAQSQGYNKDYQTFLQEKGRNSGSPPATIAKEIFEADEGAQAGQNVITALDRALEINNTAWDGPTADFSSSAWALFGNQDAATTQELKNLVTANALESLKATFGAAPTEGERKILLEVQGSINQPRAVREAIFKRAKAAAERRLRFNKERGSSLRGGTYFDPGYSPVTGTTGSDMSDIDAILTEQGL